MSSRRSRSGFTLIELLVVIAIIAILAAILFPVFAQAREKARAVSCLSNTKQLSLGFLMYVQDYDEVFPGVWTGHIVPGELWGWNFCIYPYVKNLNVYDCPDKPIQHWTGAMDMRQGSADYGYADQFGGYGYNAFYDWTGAAGQGVGRATAGGGGGAALGAVVTPAQCYLLADSRIYAYYAFGLCQSNFMSAVSTAMAPAFRHPASASGGSRTNMAYCDGHVHSETKNHVMDSYDARHQWAVDDTFHGANYWPPEGGFNGPDDSVP